VISVDEYNHSLQFLIKDHQQQIQSSPKQFNKLRASLKLLDKQQGLLHLRGCFSNVDLTYDVRPTISDSSRQRKLAFSTSGMLTNLVLHHGVDYIGIRPKIVLDSAEKWRKAVKNIIRKCVVCKRYQGKTQCCLWKHLIS